MRCFHLARSSASSSTVFPQLFFGRPGGLLPSRVSSMILHRGSCSSLLLTCPYHLSLLLLITAAQLHIYLPPLHSSHGPAVTLQQCTWAFSCCSSSALLSVYLSWAILQSHRALPIECTHRILALCTRPACSCSLRDKRSTSICAMLLKLSYSLLFLLLLHSPVSLPGSRTPPHPQSPHLQCEYHHFLHAHCDPPGQRR